MRDGIVLGATPPIGHFYQASVTFQYIMTISLPREANIALRLGGGGGQVTLDAGSVRLTLLAQLVFSMLPMIHLLNVGLTSAFQV